MPTSHDHSHKSKRRNTSPGIALALLGAGALIGAALMSAVQLRPAAPAAQLAPAAPQGQEPVRTSSSFTAPVVSVDGDGLVVALPDMPHAGKPVPTVRVTVNASTVLRAHTPKTPQEIDKAQGPTSAPDTSKGLPPPPEKKDADLFDDSAITLADLAKDDVVRIGTTDAPGGMAIVATDVTLIFRPSAAQDAPGATPGGQPPPPERPAARPSR